MSWDFQPLRITAELANSLCGNNPFFPLDGIIMMEALWRENGCTWASMPDPKDELRFPAAERVPLVIRRKNTGFWYYACSFAFYQTLAEEIQYWHKRARIQYEQHLNFQGKRGKIDDATGRFRAYRMPLRTFVTPKLTWYAVGDRRGVEDYLRRVTNIGKKRAQGNGEVMRWEVEEIESDYSEQRNGTWTRAIPVNILDRFLVNCTFHSFRPPYWHHDNFAMCCMPGSEVANAT